MDDAQTWLLIFFSLFAFLSVILFSLPFLKKDAQRARLKVIAKRREELSRQQREEVQRERVGARAKKRTDLMKRILKAAKLESSMASPETRLLLLNAGYRSQNTPLVFFFIRMGAFFGFMAFATFYVRVLRPDLQVMLQVSAVLGSAAFGYYLPTMLVKSTAQKRQQEMNLAFPDTLDLLVICTESGLGLEAAFARVTDEVGQASPVLAEELGLLGAELAFLGDRRKAYTNFSDRTGLPSAKALATSLIQSDKYGTPVVQALKVLSNESRHERMNRAEKKAAQLPAMLTVPMIVFFLPPLFVVIMGPALIRVSQMFGGGH